MRPQLHPKELIMRGMSACGWANIRLWRGIPYVTESDKRWVDDMINRPYDFYSLYDLTGE